MKSTITLSKKNVMQVIALSALLPIPLNFIIIYLNPIAIFTNFYDKATWITFCGNYMGGLMGGIVSLIILNKTLKQTSIQHEELKRIQIVCWQRIKYQPCQHIFSYFRFFSSHHR